jgi:hypothetical protein
VLANGALLLLLCAGVDTDAKGSAMSYVKSVIRNWFPLAVIITALIGLVYVVGQQGYRTSADDPQIQLAEDAAKALSAGQSPQSVLPSVQVDIANSLAPYMVIYDERGQALVASGLLHGQMPALPAGVFSYTREHTQDRLTWQPERGVRSAIVVAAYGGAHPGFVMAGRSLREVERREDNLLLMVGAAWLVTLAAALVSVVVVNLVLAERRKPV